MIPKLTHTEACKLVEASLERVAKTLAYIRLRLAKRPSNKPIQLRLFEQNALEEADLLCNINWYGAYLKGAKTMLRLLRDNYLCEEPHPAGLRDKDSGILSKATLDLIMNDTLSTEKFLSQNYDEIHYTDHEYNKKGKLIKCRAYFAKKVMGYKEV